MTPAAAGQATPLPLSALEITALPPVAGHTPPTSPERNVANLMGELGFSKASSLSFNQEYMERCGRQGGEAIL